MSLPIFCLGLLVIFKKMKKKMPNEKLRFLINQQFAKMSLADGNGSATVLRLH